MAVEPRPGAEIKNQAIEKLAAKNARMARKSGTGLGFVGCCSYNSCISAPHSSALFRHKINREAADIGDNRDAACVTKQTEGGGEEDTHFRGNIPHITMWSPQVGGQGCESVSPRERNTMVMKAALQAENLSVHFPDSTDNPRQSFNKSSEHSVQTKGGLMKISYSGREPGDAEPRLGVE